MITVKQASYEGGYRIRVIFNGGEEGVVDLEDLIKRYPIAHPLLQQTEFSKFYLDEWPTLAWSCGFDVSPELLYERATGKVPEWRHNNTMAA